jgi:hypothetical protein
MRRWDSLFDKISREGYESLTSQERTCASVRAMIDATQNGGLISYFYNSGADHLDDCRAALLTLEEPEVLARLDRVAALFPLESLATLDGRNDVINSWDDDDESTDELLEQIDEELYELFDDLEKKLDGLVAAD